MAAGVTGRPAVSFHFDTAPTPQLIFKSSAIRSSRMQRLAYVPRRVSVV